VCIRKTLTRKLFHSAQTSVHTQGTSIVIRPFHTGATWEAALLQRRGHITTRMQTTQLNKVIAYAWFQASERMWLITAPFWVVTLDSLTLRLEPIGCPETSVRNYNYSLRNNPEGRSHQSDWLTDMLCNYLTN